jgi:hypothetical protein
MKLSTWHYFSVLNIVISLALLAYVQEVFLSDDMFYNFYIQQLSEEQIEKMLNQQHEYSYLGYIITPIFYIIKLLIVSTCLYTGSYISQKQAIRFKDLMSIVVVADFIFLIPALFKIVWFTFGKTDFTLEDLQHFSPLSLLNIFDVQHVEKWLIYPLHAFNVFEIAFWFLLGWLLMPILKKGFTESFTFVMASYGSAFLMWIVLVVFITVTLT